LPLYPVLCKMVMLVTGLDWNTVAISVSVVAAFAATLVTYKLFAHFLSTQQAFFAIVLFCIAPVAPVYQVAYAESLQLLLIATALLLLVQRKYLWIIPVAILLGFTRPGALALALTLGLHGVFRWVRGRGRSFPVRERWQLFSATAVSLLAGFAWAAIAGIVTGAPNAYVETELAWRSPYIGWVELVPFTPWMQAAEYWFRAPMSFFVFGGVIALFAAIIFAPASRRLGLDMLSLIHI
jgi:Gpi18-like mannosyltransferase